MQGRVKAKTSPFVGTYGTHVAGTARKLVHTKRIEAQKCVVVDTVCKVSLHDATLKIEVILSLLQEARIQTS